jgi:CRP/FNR family transcriptional regulator, cyclic AMP receptor protein
MRKAMYLMGALDDSDIEWLAANGKSLRLAPNQVLVHEGQPIDFLFVVLDGRLAVKAGAAQVATLLAGEVVGEISFVDPRPPLATVTALDAARMLAVRRDVLQTKLSADARFAANFYRALATFLADRLRATTTRLGYGRPEQDAAPESADELGDDLMETVSLGTQRFDNLLRRLSSG